MLRNSTIVMLVLVSLSTFAAAQITMTVSPALVTSCDSRGLGQVRVFWSNAGPGPVMVRVGGPTGIAFTGPWYPTGQADTGYWVVDGTVFSLTDSTGHELARASANVRCAPTPLTTGSYFPLSVGNEWVYQALSRNSGPYYFDRRVTGVRTVAGVLWYVVGSTSAFNGLVTPVSEELYRQDDQGRIHRLNQNTSVDEIFIDPTGGAATIIIVNKGQPLLTPLGMFPDSLAYTINGGLDGETGNYVRGVGLNHSTANLLTGSSGGFTQSYDLIYARISGQRYSLQQPALDISAEATDLYVTAKYVTNCALPCYFAACGLGGSQPDPPGTYKPCFQARVRLSGPFTFTTGQSVTMSLVDSTGKVIDTQSATVVPDPTAEELVFARQLILYSAPNVPIPAGAYKLQVKLTANGTEAASSTLGINVW